MLLVLPTGIVDEEASATWHSVTLAASSAFFTSRAGRYPRAYPARCAASFVPLVFGELPVWANREADRLASDAPMSHEHLLAHSGGTQPVPLQCVIPMNLIARRRCLHLIDVGLCQFRHVVSHQKRAFLAHVQQCGARYDKIRQTRNHDKTLIHKGYTG